MKKYKFWENIADSGKTDEKQVLKITSLCVWSLLLRYLSVVLCEVCRHLSRFSKLLIDSLNSDLSKMGDLTTLASVLDVNSSSEPSNGSADNFSSTLSSVSTTTSSTWGSCMGPHHDFNSSFLQHASGKGIAGACVWAAIFITCHQVRNSFQKFNV